MNIRPAETGDEGVVLGLESHGSIATLIVQVGEDELAHIYGDWRMVADLVDAFVGERVEVVEAEGSAYGAHGIRPWTLRSADRVHLRHRRIQSDLTHI